jgi:hypothetical protein
MSFNILKTKKHGQVKMFESIAMLLVFFFLIAIGLKFYGNIQINSLERTKERFITMDSIKMAILLSNLPEVKCSIQNVQKGACIDLYKVMAWEQVSQIEPAKSYYFNLLGHSTIVLEERIGADRWKSYLMHNKTFKENYSTSVTPLPVAVWNPNLRRHNFGVLYVKVHSET